MGRSMQSIHVWCWTSSTALSWCSAPQASRSVEFTCGMMKTQKRKFSEAFHLSGPKALPSVLLNLRWTHLGQYNCLFLLKDLRVIATRKERNMPWIIIITFKILLCLILESWLLPASKMPTPAAMWLLPGFLTLHASPCPELGPFGEGQGGIKLAMIRYFIPHFEVTMKLCWLCNDAYGNLWVASRVYSSLCCIQHTDGVCKTFYPPLYNHCETRVLTVSPPLPACPPISLLPPPNIAYFSTEKISFIKLRASASHTNLLQLASY